MISRAAREMYSGPIFMALSYPEKRFSSGVLGLRPWSA